MADYGTTAGVPELATNKTENMFLNFDSDNKACNFGIQHVLQFIGMRKITEMPEMSPDMKEF